MKSSAGVLLSIAGLCVLLHLPIVAQQQPDESKFFLKHLVVSSEAVQSTPAHSRAYRIPGKRASQYTREDWSTVIDSTWGPGQPAAEQLQVFDSFSNLVRQYWAGFPNLAPNCSWWDSVRNVYRPQIGSGLSRGRFYALMSRMWMALSELHSYIYDPKVDQAFGSTSFKYRPGVPLLNIGPYLTSLLGAAVTPLPDSTNLVYRVAPDNPLHLEAGDLILGYEGIPWKRLYPQLVNAGVPVSYWNSWPGSSPASVGQFWLMSVGLNWGLFETIDVVKYKSGDTLHLPTARLDTIFQSIWQSDQVPVAGVPMPETQAMDGPVTQGIVEGTNIGYIYVWDWYSALTEQRFSAAIHDLCYTKGVDGLVIDCRMNWGGDFTRGNAGLSQLFNFDPTANLQRAARTSVTDCMAFALAASPWPIVPTTLYQRPIALLIGPGCFSVGDYNALRLQFHPMARLFGKPTNGAFVAGTSASGTLSDGWKYSFPTSMTYSLVPGEGYLLHKGAKPDEEVWLTRDGVAKGEDEVVKRALAWINTLSYAHDVQLTQPSRDTLRITARVKNPLLHALKVTANLKDGLGTIIDSLVLKDDGLHGDGAAGDDLWGYRFVPPGDAMIHLSVRTDDLSAATSRTLPDAATIQFTRNALISVDTRLVELGPISMSTSRYDTTFLVRNIGYAADSLTVSLDPGTVLPDTAVSAFPKLFTLAPGDSQKVTFRIRPYLLPPQYYVAQVIVEPKYAFGPARFEKNYQFQVVVTGSVSDLTDVPTAFVLQQSYPNPFNPSTTIRYGLPHRSPVQLAVFNALGQKVATLVQEEQDAGYHEVKCDGKRLSSGVYFYRLVASDYVSTKRMLIVK
jgi:hypothetical protein